MLRRFLAKGRPSDRDALDRLRILQAQVVHALATPPRELVETWRSTWSRDDWTAFLTKMNEVRAALEADLRRDGLWKRMTRDEQLFVATPMLELTPQQHLNASWLMEGAGCLLWALNLIEALPPYDSPFDPEVLKGIPSDLVHPGRARLRPAVELDQARDRAELWHWRSRTRQVQEAGGFEETLPEGLTFERIVAMSASAAQERGDITQVLDGDFPAFGKPYRHATSDEYSILTSIALERHRALNWLCGMAPGNRWHETPTDT